MSIDPISLARLGVENEIRYIFNESWYYFSIMYGSKYPEFYKYISETRDVNAFCDKFLNAGPEETFDMVEALVNKCFEGIKDAIFKNNRFRVLLAKKVARGTLTDHVLCSFVMHASKHDDLAEFLYQTTQVLVSIRMCREPMMCSCTEGETIYNNVLTNRRILKLLLKSEGLHILPKSPKGCNSIWKGVTHLPNDANIINFVVSIKEDFRVYSLVTSPNYLNKKDRVDAMLRLSDNINRFFAHSLLNKSIVNEVCIAHEVRNTIVCDGIPSICGLPQMNVCFTQQSHRHSPSPETILNTDDMATILDILNMELSDVNIEFLPSKYL